MKNLLKVSLITAILGTLAIVFLSNNLEPSTTAISSINEKMLDEWVKISGKVVDESSFEHLRILTIDDGSASIKALLREDINKSFKGSTMTILGKVIEYKNELEVEISRINAA